MRPLRRGARPRVSGGSALVFSARFFVRAKTVENSGLFSIRAVVVKRFQANNSNFCRSRARASLRDQPRALPAWDQQEETEQSDSRTDRGRTLLNTPTLPASITKCMSV